MERFDPEKMVKEVHEITETLVKIKAGTLSEREFGGIMDFQDHAFVDNSKKKYGDYGDEYDDYYEGGYGDEDEYGIEKHRYIQKTLSKKAGSRKVTNK